MKAYSIGDRTDADKGMEIVWAKNSKEARGQQSGEIDVDSFVDLQVLRQPDFDDMENLNERELTKEKWRNGWWFNQNGYPDCETATDEDFFRWYDKVWNTNIS